MTSKTSLFNKRIYKSTLRRFYLGSIAYFLLLFLTSCMIMLLTLDPFEAPIYYQDHSSILRSGILNISVIISVAVPTFVSLLIYGFVHSRKTAIFVHSLPVSRTANYISSLAAGLTLMILPIAANTLALVIMHFAGYSQYYTISSCFAYMGVNILTVFVLLSYSSICAMLTGNRFAFVGLNILIHFFIPLIVACFGIFSECFLYGYASDNVILNFVSENNPIMWLSSLVSQLSSVTPTIDVSKIVWNIIVAVILYALSLILYKKRRIETAEDVAAYKCLYPIFKYLVTFIGALTAFAICGEMTEESPLWVLVIVAIVSFVLYFAAEMILRKTLKIWKESYKGFSAFSVVMAVIFGVFSQTSFFGFESYVPENDKIASASIYNYYYQEKIPSTTDKQLIEYVTSVHTGFTAKVPEKVFMQNAVNNDTRLHIEYTLDNGRQIKRVYNLSLDEAHKIMTRMYQNTDYKTQSEEIFNKNFDKVYDVYFEYNGEASVSEAHREELIDCIKKDIIALGYDQLHTDNASWGIVINVVFKLKKVPEGSFYETQDLNIRINANYENTIKFLEKNGYMDWFPIELSEESNYYLCKKTAYDNMIEDKKHQEDITIRDSSEIELDIPQGATKISHEKLPHIKNFLYTYNPSYIYGDDSYILIAIKYNNLDSVVSEIRGEDALKLINELGL